MICFVGVGLTKKRSTSTPISYPVIFKIKPYKQPSAPTQVYINKIAYTGPGLYSIQIRVVPKPGPNSVYKRYVL